MNESDQIRALMEIPADSSVHRAPSAPESERAVLGLALNRRVALSVLFSLIQPMHFHLTAHRTIAEEILALDRDGMDPDRILVLQALRAKGRDREIGGVSYLAELESYTFPENWESHCDAILKTYTLRQMFEKFTSLATLAQHATGSELDELLGKAESAVSAISGNSLKPSSMSTPGEEAQELGISFEEWCSPGFADVPNPFPTMEQTLDGFRNGELILLAARPSQGKTAMACRMMESWAKQGIGVGFFALEMSKQSLYSRMASSIAGINSTRARLKDKAKHPLTIFEEQRLSDAYEEIKTWKIRMTDQPKATIPQIRACMRPLVAAGKIKIAIVDYLGLMTTPTKAENRNNELGEISRGLKMLSRELNIPILALHQLSREASKGGPPKLEHLRESGRLEEDADIVLLIHQKEPDSQEPVKDVDLIVAKQRNGPRAACPFQFESKTARFEERA